jgi:GxxExxY protein
VSEGLNHGFHGGRGTLLFGEETYQVRGAGIAVSQELGSGFLEAVYQERLALEMKSRDIPFAASPALSLHHKGQLLKQTYVPDFVVFNQIIVELKVAREIAPEHRAQVLNYLKATGLRLGLLVNFGTSPARIERLIL